MGNKIVVVIEGDFGPDERYNDMMKVYELFDRMGLDSYGYNDGIYYAVECNGSEA